MSLEIRLEEPRSEFTPLQAVAHPSASVATMVTTVINKTEAEEASKIKTLELEQLVQWPEQVLVLELLEVVVELESPAL